MDADIEYQKINSDADADADIVLSIFKNIHWQTLVDNLIFLTKQYRTFEAFMFRYIKDTKEINVE